MKNLKTIMAAGTCLVLLPVSAFAETRDYDVGDFSRIKVAQGLKQMSVSVRAFPCPHKAQTGKWIS